MKSMNLRLDDETHAMLTEQTKASLRSANAQIVWLIRRESETTQTGEETK
jgi:hypothetical protein